MQATDRIWFNGELVGWDDATVHVGAHTLHYGSGVFEGLRCYETDDGPAVFRLTDHLRRLARSAQLVGMELPYSVDELRTACLELLAVNRLRTGYVRPICFHGSGDLGRPVRTGPVDVAIMAWPWASLMGEEGLRAGIDVKTSSWQRVAANEIPHTSKATGIYLNSILALEEAKRAGYQEAVLLTGDGYVADGSAENGFVVADGTLVTPPLSLGILPGVTRAAVIELARELGHPVEERNLIRSDLVLAEELFLTGTAAEVTPVRSFDGVHIGVGPVTLELQGAFFELVRGRRGHDDWLERVPVATTAGAPAEAAPG